MSDEDLRRVHYCYQIGSTFTSLALFEDTIIEAMMICDRVKVGQALGSEIAVWEQMLAKQKELKDSTLGSLIRILGRHEFRIEDMQYLGWLKTKRDTFVHKHFMSNPWPGDLTSDDYRHNIRNLLALEITFKRASVKIWNIFARAGLLLTFDIDDGSKLIQNVDLDQILFGKE